MKSQIKLGRIAGIDIGIHYSWIVIAVLIVFSLVARFHGVDPEWSGTIVWSAAVVTAVLFFGSLLLHELAHSLVAKSRGLRVRAITLFALGGVSQIESEPSDAKAEFWIAIVGPLTSAAIGFILVLGAHISGGWAPGTEPETPVIAVLLWLGYINIMLAAFNMIPGYPLDGGRVLRAIVWWATGNMERSTFAAARVGQVVAFLFILYGLLRFFVGANLGGLWLAFIGWFLLDAAKSSYAMAALATGLRDWRVADIMQRDCARVDGYLSLRDFVDEFLLRSGNRCFAVVQDNLVAGLITPAEVRNVARENWTQTSVQSVMRPLSLMRTVSPEMPAIKAVELLSRENLGQMPVVSQGKLQGIFSREQVSRFLQIHSGLGAEAHDPAA